MTSSAVKEVCTKLISSFENEEQGCLFCRGTINHQRRSTSTVCLHHQNYFWKRFAARWMHC